MTISNVGRSASTHCGLCGERKRDAKGVKVCPHCDSLCANPRSCHLCLTIFPPRRAA